ncbi:MAG: cobalt ECF transporter T component CbiQ [Methanobacteriota archaeon]|nr:MAG: cobalt ECF transporter T component CbiQ [Euryarchaeota archaeon]
MKHTTIDHYAKASPFYRIDPRAKIVGFLLFVICVALMQSLAFLLLAFIIIFMVAVASAVPAWHFVTRYFIAFPFIIIASIAALFAAGSEAALSMLVRISSCVIALIVLSTTTDFLDLLKGFQWMRVPQIFLNLLLFMYRYIFLFREELHRMIQAGKARGFQGGRHLLDRKGMRTISYSAGATLVRASERGERIYDAMLTRGYDGKVKTLTPLRFGAVAWFTFLFLSFVSLLLLLSDWKVIVWAF